MDMIKFNGVSVEGVSEMAGTTVSSDKRLPCRFTITFDAPVFFKKGDIYNLQVGETNLNCKYISRSKNNKTSTFEILV